jgi:hypothetical protein
MLACGPSSYRGRSPQDLTAAPDCDQDRSSEGWRAAEVQEPLVRSSWAALLTTRKEAAGCFIDEEIPSQHVIILSENLVGETTIKLRRSSFGIQKGWVNRYVWSNCSKRRSGHMWISGIYIPEDRTAQYSFRLYFASDRYSSRSAVCSLLASASMVMEAGPPSVVALGRS